MAGPETLGMAFIPSSLALRSLWQSKASLWHALKPRKTPLVDPILPKLAKMGLKMAVLRPKMAKMRPKTVKIGPKMGRRGPKMAKLGPKMADLGQ